MAGRKWEKFNLSGALPETLVGLLQDIREDGIEPVGNLLEQLATLLEALSVFLLAIDDPIAAIILAAIEAVQALIDTWLVTYGVHVLLTPPTTVSAQSLLADMSERVPRSDDPGVHGLQQWYDIFVESLYDPDDPHAPTYPSDDYVAAVVLIFGVKGLTELLRLVIQLRRLFGDLAPYSLDNDIIPVPENFKLRTTSVNAPQDDTVVLLGDTNPDTSSYTALLTWRRPNGFDSAVRLLKGSFTRIKATRVLMRTDRPWSQIDAGTDLSAYVVYETDLPGINSSVRVRVDPDQFPVYYFTACYDIEVYVPVEEVDETAGAGAQDAGVPAGAVAATFTGSDGSSEGYFEVELLQFAKLATNVTVNTDLQRLPRRQLTGGVAPDWVSLASPIDLLPGLRSALIELREILQTIADDYGGLRKDLLEAIELLREYTAFYLRKVQAIEEVMRTLQEVLEALDDADVYRYMFSGKGGTSLMVEEVRAAIFDPESRNVPPYNNRGDMVVGLVVATGGGLPQPIQAMADLLRLLFGVVFNDRDLNTPTTELPDTIDQSALTVDYSQVTALIDANTAALEQEAAQLLESPLAAALPDDLPAIRDLLPNNEC